MEPLQIEDFNMKELHELEDHNKTTLNEQNQIGDNNILDCQKWNEKIVSFNASFDNNDNESMKSILNDIKSCLIKNDELSGDHLNIIESTYFFHNIIKSFYSNDSELVFNAIDCFSKILYSSSDSVKIVCVNGFLNQLIDVFKKRMYEFNNEILKAFFWAFGNISSDGPEWRFQMIQLKILPLYSFFLTNEKMDLSVIETVLSCILNLFNSILEDEQFPYCQISSILVSIKQLLEKMLISTNHDFQCRLKISLLCLHIFIAYGRCVANIYVLLLLEIPSFLYTILTPAVHTDLKQDIVESIITSLQSVFSLGPIQELQKISKIVDINVFSSYIDINASDITEGILKILYSLLYISDQAIIDAQNAGLFDIILEIKDDVNFKLKKCIIGVICAAIINGTSRKEIEIFLNQDIIDLLIENLELEDISQAYNIPYALFILSQLVQEDDQLYSSMCEYHRNIEPIQNYVYLEM